MKLTEKKSKVPSTFLTSYISNAWDQVGIIKEDLDAIKKEFSDTKIVEECLTALSDAYLILAGRFQNYLDGKGDIEQPEPSELTESLEDTSDVDLNDEIVINEPVNNDCTCGDDDIIDAFAEIPAVDTSSMEADFAKFTQQYGNGAANNNIYSQHLTPYTPEPAQPVYSSQSMSYGNNHNNNTVSTDDSNLSFDEMPAPDLDQKEYDNVMNMLSQMKL